MPLRQAEIEQIADRASQAVRAALVEMLTDNLLGEVVAVIGPNELNVEKRPKLKVRTIKLHSGHGAVIERIVQT